MVANEAKVYDFVNCTPQIPLNRENKCYVLDKR